MYIRIVRLMSNLKRSLKRNNNGLKTMIEISFKLKLLDRSKSISKRRCVRLSSARDTRPTSSDKWESVTAPCAETSKKKCMRREQPNWLNLNTNVELKQAKVPIMRC